MTRGKGGSSTRSHAPTTLGGRLKAIRRAYGWSQTTLSSLLGVAQQSVSNWEKDAVPPIGAARNNLAAVLGINWSALETGKGFQVPDGPPSMNLAREGTMAKDESNKKPLLLPKVEPGQGWVVEAGSGKSSPLDPDAVSEEIQNALEAGGSVWLVVKRAKRKPGAPKAAPAKPTPAKSSKKKP